MFSTLSPAFLFDPAGRPEQPYPHSLPHKHPHPQQYPHSLHQHIKPKGHKESRLVANLNLALSGLNPSHTLHTHTAHITTILDSPGPYPSVHTPTSSTPSISSTSRKGHTHPSPHERSPSTESMSSAHSSQSTDSSPSHSHSHHAQENEPVSHRQSMRRSTRDSLPSHPAMYIRSGASYVPRPSPDSINSYSPRASLDSIASSSSSSRSSSEREHNATPNPKDKNEARDPRPQRKVPPPLRLERSNLHHPGPTSPIIELTTPPPRVESKSALLPTPPTRTHSLSQSPSASTSKVQNQTRAQTHPQPTQTYAKPPAPLPPSPPSPHTPTEEEKRQRRLHKLMRTLGDDVPVELVYRGGARRIVGVNAFPDPPEDDRSKDSWKGKDGTKKGGAGTGAGTGLRRRGSFTLAAFPHLAAVTVGLGHVRGKSREENVRGLGRGGEGVHPIHSPGMRTHANTIHVRSRPESVLLSPMVFRRPVSQLVLFDDDDGSESESSSNHHSNAKGKSKKSKEERERAAKLARRASLHTTTVLPISPSRETYLHSPHDPDPLDTPRQSPRNLPLSQEFVTPPFRVVVHPSHEERGHRNSSDGGGGDRTPRSIYTPNSFYTPPQSEDGHNSNPSAGSSRSGSSTHLPSSSPSTSPNHAYSHLYDRPDTPFASAAVPVRAELSGLLVRDKSKRENEVVSRERAGIVKVRGKDGREREREREREKGRDLVVRREKRQGWSGEWNRGDMQDVIQTLRTLR